jgi:hypothetical protein
VIAWDRARLRALDLPVEELPVKELLWQVPEGGVASVCRSCHSEDAQPIDITVQSGRWVILDGAERLRRAVALDVATVPVRKVPTWALPLILVAS